MPKQTSYFHRVAALCLLALISSVKSDAGAGTEERCAIDDDAPRTTGASALMQKRHDVGHSLTTKKGAHHGKKKKAQAHVSHAGTVKMMLNEMNAFVEDKGESGLDPDEVEHVHSIRGLIELTVLPTVLESVESTRTELDMLYQAVVDCNAHIDEIANLTLEKTDHLRQWEELHKECREKQEEIIQKKYDICTQLNRSRLTIYSPEGDELVSPDVDEDVMIQYLEKMSGFFCGRWEVFYVEWQECEQTIINYTILHSECTVLQKTFEEHSCEWKRELLTTCETYDTCWTNSAAAYRERKRALLQYHAELIAAYEGIVKIQCLWSAWIWDGMPCTVNKTRVKECFEYPANLTNVTIEYPPLPTPPICDTSSVGFDTCSPDWLVQKYGSLPVGEEIQRELQSSCEPCPPYTYTLPPSEVDYISMENMHHVGANTFIKIGGSLGCDASLKSRHPNVKKLVVSPKDIDGQVNIRFYRGFVQFKVNLASYICTIDGLDVSPYRVGDNIGLEFRDGEVFFSRNDVVFASLPSEIDYGWADVEVCSLPGTSVTLIAVLVDLDEIEDLDDNTSDVNASER